MHSFGDVKYHVTVSLRLCSAAVPQNRNSTIAVVLGACLLLHLPETVPLN